MLRIITTRRLKDMEQRLNDNFTMSTKLARGVVHLLDKYGTYIENEMGSGDVSYIVGKQLFEFNEFPSLFSGFYIDKMRVSAANFINMIYVAKGMQS